MPSPVRSDAPCDRLTSDQTVSGTQPLAEPVRLVIFDSRIDDLSYLLDGLQPNVSAHVLNPDDDGIEQISTLLKATAADEVTLVAHGFSGGVLLGAGALMLSNLTTYEPQLRRWFSGSAAPRLALLVGKVAQGQVGHEFISQLTTITGAQVRASSAPLGQGHWLTATAKAFKPLVLNTYRATL